jgi:AraC-like DNA-binding protein
MNDDDVNLLLLPDGRFGALRGDQLIGALSGATVPQRAGAPLQVEYATNTDQRGWQLELRVPFAGLGLKPMAGLRLGVDVAANDWLIDHPPGASGALTPETVKQLANRAIIPPSPDPAVGTQLLPRSWTGANDFGYPDRWRTLQLTGGPPLSERLVRVLGAKVLVWAGLLSLCCLSGAAWIHLWHRRRLRDLLRRLPAVADAVPPPEQIPEHSLEEDSALDPREREFADQVLKHVRGNLADSLSPAELAAQFHVSVRTLQRRLKAGLGTSPQDLVLAARLDAARALLKEGRLRISEVAARVGFDDPSHFSRRYRQAFGHAPSDEH